MGLTLKLKFIKFWEKIICNPFNFVASQVMQGPCGYLGIPAIQRHHLIQGNERTQMQVPTLKPGLTDRGQPVNKLVARGRQRIGY